MKITPYQPLCSIKLKKTIGRKASSSGFPVSQRYSGRDDSIEISDLLGDGGGVRTSKSVRQPAGGFNITFNDQMHPVKLDSWYGLIEPMDVIEIRMAHDPTVTDYSTQEDGLPIIMRGFVSSVRRTRGMGDDGVPYSTVTISGQDYGKIWQMMQIWFNPYGTIALDLVASFPLFERYGVTWDQNIPAHQFVDEVRSKVINVFLDGLATAADASTGAGKGYTPHIKQLQMASQLVTNGVVSPFGINSFQGGSVYDLLKYYCDIGPFHELFIEDREDAPYIVFRPVPFADASGTMAFADEWSGNLPDPIDIPAADVISGSAERSDSGVANYYWVDSARYQLGGTDVLKMSSGAGDVSTFFLSNYQNAIPGLYGIRRMEVSSQMAGNDSVGRDGQSAASMQSENAVALAWLEDRRKKLMAINKDNALFESGTLRLRGNEKIKAGSRLRFTEGALIWTVYVESVDHEYMPYVGMFTTVNVERGTGFIKRIQLADGASAPYFAERSVAWEA